MRDFLIKVLLFTLLFFLADKAAYFILVRGQDKVHDRRLQMLINGEINKDIIAIGSSRGAKAVIAQQIEDSTDYSCFNLCYSSADINYHEFLVRTLFRYNQTPKAIMLVLDDPMELWHHDNSYFPTRNLYPLVHRNYINEALISADDHSMVTRFLWTARIKDQHLFPEYQKVHAFDTVRADGSQTLSYYAENRDFQRYEYDYEIENELDWKIKKLAEIEQLCQENHVKLILVYPPNYKVHSHPFVARMKHFTGEEVAHWEYNYQDSTYLNKDLYYDPDHLHISGAQYFTGELVDRLNNGGLK